MRTPPCYRGIADYNSSVVILAYKNDLGLIGFFHFHLDIFYESFELPKAFMD